MIAYNYIVLHFDRNNILQLKTKSVVNEDVI